MLCFHDFGQFWLSKEKKLDNKFISFIKSDVFCMV